MDTPTIFGLQFVLSLLMFTLIAKWFVTPRLANKPIHTALIVLTIPHTFRHLGLAFLVPGLVTDDIPSSFASAAAYGDFVSGLLAIVVLFALRGGWGVAMPMVWLLNIVGTLDLLNALRNFNVLPHLHTTWYIPTFIVPLLLVTHAMMFSQLLRRARSANTAVPGKSFSALPGPSSN